MTRVVRLILVLSTAVALPAAAQEPPEPPARKVLRLGANSDGAASGLRGRGYFYTACAENYTGAFDFDRAEACITFNQLMRNGFTAMWPREAHWVWGVPKTEWDRAVARVPALANATGGGWTVSSSHQPGVDDLGPADGSLGIRHAGVSSTTDGGCRDHRFGVPTLLAGSDCPQTWGSAGWEGARPITPEVWLARFQANLSAFDFDFWRVPDGDLDAAGLDRETPIGTFQTYGYTSDFSQEILCGTATIRNWAHVVPAGSAVAPGGCSGVDSTRRRPGWPLGIEVRFDAFTFDQLLLREVAFYQVTFTNRSRLVYGVGLDYDSLYISLQNGWFGGSSGTALLYHIPEIGALMGKSVPQEVCNTAKLVSDFTCGAWGTNHGWNRGAAALLVLKSPIGDLRNRLFTQPGSPFYAPAHPRAGDTLTFNHAHLCGFRACAATTWSVNPTTVPDAERRAFGMLSSTEENVFGNRTTGNLTDQVYWHTFRNTGFPAVRWAPGQPLAAGGGFNKWAPAMAGTSWDWNKDGVEDTIAADNCFLDGCTALWGDTLPNGKYNAYSNTNGTLGVGPLHLPPDSTVGFVVAITTAQSDDSAGFMAQVQAAVDHYLAFYPTARPAPPCRMLGVTRRTVAEGPEVSLSWDDICYPGRWTDELLARQYDLLLAAPAGTVTARLRQLNPRLDDTLAYLVQHNLAALHVYKSCDDGASWTADVDCLADTAAGGRFDPVGYRPYASYEAGDLPSGFVDASVVPGRNYVYALVAETRGLEIPVINGDSVTVSGSDTVCASGCRIETFPAAPPIFTPLSASAGDPWVARVYVTISRQSGAARARVAVIDSAGLIPWDRVVFTFADDSIPAGTFRILAGDSARATQVEYRTGQTLDSVRTRVVLRVPATQGDSLVVSGTNPGGLTPSGGTSSVLVTAPTPGTTVTTVTHEVKVPLGFPQGALLLARAAGTATMDPLLLSSSFGRPTTTPIAFRSNPDYPGFDLAVDNLLPNFFAGSHVIGTTGDTILDSQRPTVSWQAALGRRYFLLSTEAGTGDYAVEWLAPAFGTQEPFRLDRVNRVDDVYTSLTARTVATIGLVSDTAALNIQAALAGRATTLDSLVPVRLPFRITNLTFRRPVDVAMRRRTGRSVLLGAGSDTLRVFVPDDVWVPGDTIYFFERRRTTGEQELTHWGTLIGCDSVTSIRTSCNPVAAGSPGATPYIPVTGGQILRVRYLTVLTAESRFTFQAVPPLRGSALVAQPNAIRSALNAVQVVPNPLILASGYAGNGLMFTHLPPRGVLRIYTVSGQFIQQITWTEADLRGDGDLIWDLKTREGQLVRGGLYLYVLHATDANGGTIGTRRGKFVVIR